MRYRRALFLLSICPFLVFAQEEYQKAFRDAGIYYGRKEWNKALEYFEKALKAKPDSAEAQAQFGSTLSQLSRTDEAIAALEKAIRMEQPPGRTAAYAQRELGLIYGQQKQNDKAIPAFKESLKLDPKNELAWRSLGTAHAELSHLKEAIEAWEKSLQLNPDQPKLREQVAQMRVRLTQEQAAVRAGGAATQPPVPAAKNASPSIELPPLGGRILAPDQKTLIVSMTLNAELAYIDTENDKEIKRVSLDFQPGSLAIQGKTLFVGARGASLIHALDLDTGKPVKEIKIPGEPIAQLACHPSKGKLFATNTKEEVLCIDPKSGAASKTKAKGLFLAMDPVNAAFLYTGRTSRNEWDVEAEKNEDGTTSFYFDEWGMRSMIRKYAVRDRDLKEVAANDNTAVNGRSMHLTPDGKKIMIVGGGGWRPKRGGTGGGYVIAVFETDDLKTMKGQINLDGNPQVVAFHPCLPVGVAVRMQIDQPEAILFNAKSFAQIHTWKLDKCSPSNAVGWIVFGGKGTKLVYWKAVDAGRQEIGKMYFIPLDLTEEDRSVLDKHYSQEAGKTAAAADAPKPSPAVGGKKHPAQSMLETARDLEDRGETQAAIRYYKRIAEEFYPSPEAKEALNRVSALEKKK